ncbi:hypothetical protein BX666DRAFT_1924684 [Dichotomocladium elegans]|nr:hypothetical protein BX666DRAFT_1924684 [Dichotomocladium elegans]
MQTFPTSSSTRAIPTTNPLSGAGSPSTGAFTFRSPSSTSSNPTFGSGPALGGMSSEFTFSAPSSPLKRNVSDLTLPGPSLVDPLRRTASEGSPAFTFGSSASSPAPSGSSPTGGFTFGSPATTATGQASPSVSGNFSFGITGNGTTTSAGTAQTPTFSFGNTVSASTTTSSTASASTPKPAFTFGLSSTTSTTPASKPDTTPKPSFTFGSPAAPTSSSPVTSTETTPKSVFSFAAPTAANQTPATPKPAASGSTSNSTLSFGSPASTSAATTTATATATATAAPVMSFGASLSGAKDTKEPPTTSTISGDSTKATTGISSFSFGSPKPASTTATSSAAPSPAPTTGSFSFGKSTDVSSPATSAASTPKFSFSAPEKKSTAAAATTTTSTIAATSAPTQAPVPKPNAFSFTKVLEDLERIASQPPSQIHASLLTPALQGLQQNQIVTVTNFRIDNILPTTRFSELPEQAQTELDQLNQYIRGETQKCDFVLRHGARQHLDTIQDTQAQTDSLVQQLGALSSNLKRQMQNIELLFDKAGAQLRHAADASSVIEACKHHGSTSRWLSGYGTDDDYFVNLSSHLQARLEEYKRTVWEIERTTESWSKQKVRTPQDIGRIMKEQNSAFLALANRVALLDEDVKGEKERYAQYVKMYC